jgi:hypothetical protein
VCDIGVSCQATSRPRTIRPSRLELHSGVLDRRARRKAVDDFVNPHLQRCNRMADNSHQPAVTLPAGHALLPDQLSKGLDDDRPEGPWEVDVQV